MEMPNGSQQDIYSSSSPPLEMPDSTMHDSDDDYYSIARDRPRREIKRPRRYSEPDLVAYTLTVAEETNESGESQTYSEIVSCPNSSKWLVAMHEEIESLHKNDTWELVRLPKGQIAVGCKWVNKKKEGNPHVENARFKARLVAKGYTQKQVVDFNEVFSGCPSHFYSCASCIRCLAGSRVKAT